jgi:hypothetical protein
MKQDSFKLLKTIHTVIVASMGGFAILVFALAKSGNLHPAAAGTNVEKTLQVTAILFSVILFIIGLNLFKRGMLKARNSGEGGQERFAKYRSACVLWWAMIEAPGIFAAVGYALTGNFAFLLLAAAHVLALLTFMPRKENIIVLLNLTPQEVKQLEGR